MRRVEMSSRLLEADYGVTAPQLICLIEIAGAGSITQIELSRRVHLSASTLVGVLDRLEAKKLIHRERDEVDRRRINIHPTTSGKHLIHEAPPPLQDTLLKGLGELSKRELATMATALEHLVDLLEAREVAGEPMLAPGPIPKLDV
jgi:DNA-binding MarR family transcriptional regulator